MNAFVSKFFQGILFVFSAILYTWALIVSVGNFLGILELSASFLHVSVFGWVVLVLGILLPPVVAVITFLMTKLHPEKRIFVFFAGVACVAVLQVNAQYLSFLYV